MRVWFMRQLRVISGIAAVMVSIAVAACGSDGATVDAVLRVDTEAPIARTSERYLSLGVDSAQIVGGLFWGADEGQTTSGVGSERVDPYDFSRPKLRAMAAALGAVRLRIGGSEADRVYLDLSDAPAEEAPGLYEEVMTRAQWDGLADFAKAVGWDIVFTVNAGPGPRDAEKRWQPENVRPLIEHIVAREDPVFALELGNEPNGFRLIHGPEWQPTGAELADDYGRLRALLDALRPETRLGGPASIWWPVLEEIGPIYPEFMAAGGGEHLDFVSWHYYPMQSQRCPFLTREATFESALAPETFDDILNYDAQVRAERDAHAPRLPIWIGETGGVQCGGQAGVSDRFVGTFWWLDMLGRLATLGYETVVRHTLSGSDYGIIDEATLAPRPDYWATLLWQRLMGSEVLAATLEARALEEVPGTLRAYAHCDREGELAALVMNTDTQVPMRIGLSGLSRQGAEIFVGSARALDAEQIEVNGVPVAVADDGTPPAQLGVPLAGGAVTLAPATWAFLRFPAERCGGS